MKKRTKKTLEKVAKKMVNKRLSAPSAWEKLEIDTPQKVEVKPYSATIKILGKVYNSTGSTAREAIENLKPNGKCAGTSLLSVSKGDIRRDKVIPAFQVYRLFSPSKMMRELALKGVSSLFENL